MAGDAEKTHDLLLLHLEQRFHGSALGEDGVHVFRQTNVMQLPQIDVIGIQKDERLFDHAQ